MLSSLHALVADYWFWGLVGMVAGGALSVRNLLKTGFGFPLAVALVTLATYGLLLGMRLLGILAQDPGISLTVLVGELLNPVMLPRSVMGGPPAGFAVVALTLLVVRRPVWESLGSVAPGFALGHAISRVGCLFNGCCYGTPSDLPWAIASDALHTHVHPTQIYNLLTELLAVVVMQLLWRNRPQWRRYLGSLYLAWFCLSRFGLEFVRGEPPGPELIEGLRFYQSVALILLFALALMPLALLRWGRRGLLPGALSISVPVVLLLVWPGGPRPALEQPTVERPGEVGPTYLIATRTMFETDLAEQVARRKASGLRVKLRAWTEPPTARDLQAWVRAESSGQGFVLLVGDAGASEEQQEPWHVPSVLQTQASSKIQPTDALVGDLDDDRRPDLAVGRWPVRDLTGLRLQLDKLRALEARTLTVEQQRLLFWSMTETGVVNLAELGRELTQLVPRELGIFAINGDPRSGYTGHRPDQRKRFLAELGRGAIVSLVLSHGSFRSLSGGEFQGQKIGLTIEDLTRLPGGPPGGALFMLGCDSARFDLPASMGPSLAEAVVARADGPVVAVAATASTSPLANLLFIRELIRRATDRPATYGELLLTIQRRLMEMGDMTLGRVAEQDQLFARHVSALPAEQRRMLEVSTLPRGGISSYTLLGDPAVPIPWPLKMALELTPLDGAGWQLGGTVEEDCQEVRVELVSRRFEEVPADETVEARRALFEELNRSPATLEIVRRPPKTWSTQLELPPDLEPAISYLRASALCPSGLHVGVASLPAAATPAP